MTKIIKEIEEKIISDIEMALLSGQKNIIVHGIEVHLKPLKKDTRSRKEIEAKQRAKELFELIVS